MRGGADAVRAGGVVQPLEDEGDGGRRGGRQVDQGAGGAAGRRGAHVRGAAVPRHPHALHDDHVRQRARVPGEEPRVRVLDARQKACRAAREQENPAVHRLVAAAAFLAEGFQRRVPGDPRPFAHVPGLGVAPLARAVRHRRPRAGASEDGEEHGRGGVPQMRGRAVQGVLAPARPLGEFRREEGHARRRGRAEGGGGASAAHAPRGAAARAGLRPLPGDGGRARPQPGPLRPPLHRLLPARPRGGARDAGVREGARARLVPAPLLPQFGQPRQEHRPRRVRRGGQARLERAHRDRVRAPLRAGESQSEAVVPVRQKHAARAAGEGGAVHRRRAHERGVRERRRAGRVLPPPGQDAGGHRELRADRLLRAGDHGARDHRVDVLPDQPRQAAGGRVQQRRTRRRSRRSTCARRTRCSRGCSPPRAS